jgi:hypothetical protein
MPQADLHTLTGLKEEAVDEAKQKIDRTLLSLDSLAPLKGN